MLITQQAKVTKYAPIDPGDTQAGEIVEEILLYIGLGLVVIVTMDQQGDFANSYSYAVTPHQQQLIEDSAVGTPNPLAGPKFQKRLDVVWRVKNSLTSQILETREYEEDEETYETQDGEWNYTPFLVI